MGSAATVALAQRFSLAVLVTASVLREESTHT
jgi:hypothetical protein